MEQSKRICELISLKIELDYLKKVLEVNGYSKQELARAVRLKHQGEMSKNEEKEKFGFSCIPHIFRVTDRISKILDKARVQTALKPTSKVQV